MAHQPPLSRKRERQLIEQVRRGDRGALGELLGAYHRKVYHLCLRMVCHESDAADLTQEVLLKAVQHVDSFHERSRFGTWLYRIATNLSISHLRKRKIRRAASLDGDSANPGDAGLFNRGDQATTLKSLIAEHREPNPGQNVETSEQIACVLAGVDRLDDSLRAVIVLRDLQEMDYAQIAEVLSVPIGTVKSRLFRARLALRQELAAMNSPADRSTDRHP